MPRHASDATLAAGFLALAALAGCKERCVEGEFSVAGDRVVGCRLANGRFEGRVTAWSHDGAKRYECEFRDGRQHGEYSGFGPDGQTVQRGQYLAGNRHGPWTFRSDGGESEATFQAGRAEGPFVARLAAGGQLTGQYRDSARDGLWTLVSADGGTIASSEWRRGVLIKVGVLEPAVADPVLQLPFASPAREPRVALRPLRWWGRRLAALREGGARRRGQYDLLLRRARANGLTVRELDKGMEVAWTPPPPGTRCAEARP